jgi:hypothetical protein
MLNSADFFLPLFNKDFVYMTENGLNTPDKKCKEKVKTGCASANSEILTFSNPKFLKKKERVCL